MLYQEAADANTWRVLKRLMGYEYLSDFHLCGGTSLALRFGHRLSIDLDLFTKVRFERPALKLFLENEFDVFQEQFSSVSIFYFCKLDEVKTDFVYSKPPVISPFENIDGIRLWGLNDVAAMKLNAVYGRGSKKDFWDIDELLNHFTLKEMVDLFFEKHKEAFEEGLMMSLVYFDDAEKERDPTCLKKRTWKAIKKRIEKEIHNGFKFR